MKISFKKYPVTYIVVLSLLGFLIGYFIFDFFMFDFLIPLLSYMVT